MLALIMNFKVPDLNWNRDDFQRRSCFSLVARVSSCPCICRFSACSLTFSCTPSLVVFFTWLLTFLENSLPDKVFTSALMVVRKICSACRLVPTDFELANSLSTAWSRTWLMI